MKDLKNEFLEFRKPQTSYSSVSKALNPKEKIGNEIKECERMEQDKKCESSLVQVK